MTDGELLSAFEARTLPPGAFRHREHVRVAWIYLARFGRAEAERRLLDGLRAFAAAAGKPDKFDAPLTRAWVTAIAAAAAAHPQAGTFEALVSACPQLLDARTMRAAAGLAAAR